MSDDKREAAIERLENYFRSDSYRVRHIRAAMERLVEALNLLERMGIEAKDSYNGQSALDGIPFGPNGKAEDPLPRNTPSGVHYDFSTRQWKLCDPRPDSPSDQS